MRKMGEKQEQRGEVELLSAARISGAAISMARRER
jgi:hypothetical protein